MSVNYQEIINQTTARITELRGKINACQRELEAQEQMLESAKKVFHFQASDAPEIPFMPPKPFYGVLNYVDASCLFISKMGRSVSMKELVAGLKDGGVSGDDKKLYASLFSALSRESMRDNPKIVKAEKGAWKLPDM